MKTLLAVLPMILVMAGAAQADTKASKKDKDAAVAACKQENPTASKKDMKKCVSEKLKKH